MPLPAGPLGGEHQPVGDVVVHRAMDLAKGHAALRAAAGLDARGIRVETPVDFIEVGAALRRRAFFRRPLIELHELEHAA